MPDHTLVYDADCGPCSRFKRIVEFLDPRGRIAFASLQEAESLGLLDDLPFEVRQGSFHIVSREGVLYSGSEALSETLGLLPGGSVLSKAVGSVPFGQRGLRFFYSTASRVHDTGSCARDSINLNKRD